MKHFPPSQYLVCSALHRNSGCVTMIIAVLASDDFRGQRPKIFHRSNLAAIQYPEHLIAASWKRELASDWVQGRNSRQTMRFPNSTRKSASRTACSIVCRTRPTAWTVMRTCSFSADPLRRTKKCHAIDRKIRNAKRELGAPADKKASIKRFAPRWQSPQPPVEQTGPQWLRRTISL